jgi:hypothetical protein
MFDRAVVGSAAVFLREELTRTHERLVSESF